MPQNSGFLRSLHNQPPASLRAAEVCVGGGKRKKPQGDPVKSHRWSSPEDGQEGESLEGEGMPTSPLALKTLHEDGGESGWL